MGFLNGRVSFERLEVSGREFKTFNQDHIDHLEKHAIGKTGAITVDGTEVGFLGGDHLLDTNFSVEKNVVNDALHFGMRVDTDKLPSDLLRAYEMMELMNLAAENPSGQPNRSQKAAAKKAAKERLADEASDGRYRKFATTTALWDSRQEMLYYSTGSLTSIDRLTTLFKAAFSRNLTRRTAGLHAFAKAKERGSTRSYEDAEPSVFTGQARKAQVTWVPTEYGSKDFLGNEFLLWLWWITQHETDTIKLSDDTTVSVMMTKVLSLECPVAETGKETISHDSPTQLPEAKRAVMSGKLPRKSGLILVRHDEQYDLTINAESLAISGAQLPKLDTGSPRAEQEDRIDQIRHLTETVDLLFDTFCQRRLGNDWDSDLKKIRSWLKSE